MRHDKDRSSKWLLSRYGDTVLKLAGIRGFSQWRHIPTEVVAPRRLLDGLIEIQFPGERERRLVLVEIESYASNDVDRQVLDDIALVYLEHRQVPMVVSLILKNKGNIVVRGECVRTSVDDQVQFIARWPVVRLWEQDAEALFAENDASLIPWIPLARTEQSAEEIATRCVEQLTAVADRAERSALFAVTRIFAGLAHPELRASFAHIFGGMRAMIESPVLDEVREYLRDLYLTEGQLTTQRAAVHDTLDVRFGHVTPEIVAQLDAIDDLVWLKALLRFAITCPTIDAFANKLAERPTPPVGDAG